MTPSPAAPTGSFALHAHGIKKSFGGVEVLHGVDLDVAGGRTSPCSARTAPASRPS